MVRYFLSVFFFLLFFTQIYESKCSYKCLAVKRSCFFRLVVFFCDIQWQPGGALLKTTHAQGDSRAHTHTGSQTSRHGLRYWRSETSQLVSEAGGEPAPSSDFCWLVKTTLKLLTNDNTNSVHCQIHTWDRLHTPISSRVCFTQEGGRWSNVAMDSAVDDEPVAWGAGVEPGQSQVWCSGGSS